MHLKCHYEVYLIHKLTEGNTFVTLLKISDTVVVLCVLELCITSRCVQCSPSVIDTGTAA